MVREAHGGGGETALTVVGEHTDCGSTISYVIERVNVLWVINLFMPTDDLTFQRQQLRPQRDAVDHPDAICQNHRQETNVKLGFCELAFPVGV